MDRNVGLDLLIDRRRSVRRATKRDINHSVAEEIEAVRGLHAPRREIGETIQAKDLRAIATVI